MQIEWVIKKFDELSPAQLYSVLQLRNEVFIVEQNCVYQDLDNIDHHAWHLMGFIEKKLIAYTRLLPPGIMYDEASIGRVATSPSVRGTGAGKELMKKSIEVLYNFFEDIPIKIAAQFYLKKFYESFYFIQVSDIFLEDNIEHIYMIRTPK